MSQDTSHHQEQQGREQFPIAALPPVFAHLDIAEHYQQGRQWGGGKKEKGEKHHGITSFSIPSDARLGNTAFSHRI